MHRDIKTTQLLAASLAKTKAHDLGYDDAWFVENGFITEGTSSNAFIVLKNNKIITRKIGKVILPGVTRSSILEAAIFLGLEVEERPFSIKEAETAKEAFITSATNFIASVVEINKQIIGSGTVGRITKLLREQYIIDMKRTSV
jgi:D-alanine transaminase